MISSLVMTLCPPLMERLVSKTTWAGAECPHKLEIHTPATLKTKPKKVRRIGKETFWQNQKSASQASPHGREVGIP